MRKIKIQVAFLLIVSLIVAGNLTAFAAGSSEKDDKKFIAKAEKLYYYEKNRKSRYIKYRAKHPKYGVQKVVWHVDADLDRAAWVKPLKVVKQSSITVLVNKQHQLSAKYKPKDLMKVDTARMRPEAAKAVKAMKKAAKKAAKKAGIYIYANSMGFRSYAVQMSLNGNTGKKQHSPDSFRARAGFSEHQTGLAVDMKNQRGGYVSANSKAAKWMNKNAWKYGLIVRYTKENKSVTQYIAEPWHVRYIGKDHAKQMHKEKISSYEEYWVKYVAHTPSEKIDKSDKEKAK
jgi:D-alanyl-D-alanine carboxypeptidase